MSWEEYATFGRNYPGGWPTNEVLYCVRKTYDTTSENFKVSYLKHEGQHFADYKVFSKLTELYFADKTMYDVIRDLCRKCFQQDYVSGWEQWKKIPASRIHKASNS